MAPRAMAVGLALALIAISWGQASAQTSGCTTAIIGLAPCLAYITGNSSSPSSSCCSQLASVVQSQASCLCSVLNGGAASSIGITVNQTQALALPGACNVKTPPVSQCNAAAPSSPTSPATETPSTPSTPSVPSSSSPAAPSTPSVSSGSKTVPSSTSSESSDSEFSKSSRSAIVAVFFLIACVSSLTGV